MNKVRKNNDKSNIFVIISTSIIVLIFICFVLMEIPCIKIGFFSNNSLAPTLFSSIVTISVLSLTILLFIVTTNKEYYGTKYNDYINFESFYIKYKDLIIITFSTIIIAIFPFVYGNALILIVLLCYIVILLAISSIIYFMYLFQENKIKNFLLEKNTLKKNYRKILINAYQYYLEDFKRRSIDSNLQILDFIKKIKQEDCVKKDNDLDEIVIATEKKIFNELLKSKGFEYTFNNFFNVLYNLKKDIYQIRGFLFEEFDKIEYLSVEEYHQYKFVNQIQPIFYTDKISLELKITIIYNLFSRTAANKNIDTIYDKTLIDMIGKLFNVIVKEKNIKTFDRLFKLIYKELIFFGANEKQASTFFKAITINLLRFPITIAKKTQQIILTQILILSWGYIKRETTISDEQKQRMYNYLIKPVEIDFIGVKKSLIDIINSNLLEIIECFKNINFKNYDEHFDVEFHSKHLISAKKVVFDKNELINLYLYLITICSSHNYKYKFFDFSDKETAYIITRSFTEKFNGKNNELFYEQNYLKQISEFSDFFQINKKIDKKASYSIKELFLKASKISELLSAEFEGRTTYVVGSDEDPPIPFIEREGKVMGQKEVDSEMFFGGNNSLDLKVEPLIIFNLGINNRKELNDNSLYNMLGSVIDYEIARFIYRKHLKPYKLKRSETNLKELLNLIKEYDLNSISDKSTLINEYGDLLLPKYLEEIDQLPLNKKPTGLPSVIINNNRFSFKIMPLKIERMKLTDDEIAKHIEENVKMAVDLYKVGEVYLNYEKAFNKIKTEFTKDEIHVDYVIDVKDNPGFIIDFK